MHKESRLEEQRRELSTLLWRIESFFENNPSQLWIDRSKQICSGLEKLFFWSLKDLSDEELWSLFSFSVSGFFLYYHLQISRWSFPSSERFPLMRLEKKLDPIFNEIDRRKIEHLVAIPLRKTLFQTLGFPIFGIIKKTVQQLEELLWKKGFIVHHKRISKDKSLLFVETLQHHFYFVDSLEGVSYAGEQFKGYSFWDNKVYKLMRKKPWNIEEIKAIGIGFLEYQPEATFETFLRALIPSSLVEKIGADGWKVFFEKSLQDLLNELPMIFSRLNMEKFRREKEVLFLKNPAHHISSLGSGKMFPLLKKQKKVFMDKKLWFSM